MLAYPISGSERSHWIAERRGPKSRLNPREPFAFFLEKERGASGELENVATIFLTNSECPWKCAMCDLWRNTTDRPVSTAEILAQIDYALSNLGRAETVKLYNSGSFFDPRAIPEEAPPEIARLCGHFSRVIVECHPRLVSPAVIGFQQQLSGTLEMALGLETIHPGALHKLNKRVTPSQFVNAAEFLAAHKIALRSFILVNAPFIPDPEQSAWVRRSIDFAFECGSEVICLIPVRKGNGALEALEVLGDFSEPQLSRLEGALDYALGQKMGRAFADVWDLERFSRCGHCFPERQQRLVEANHSQQIQPLISCRSCGESF